ncbi:MAG: peptidylprolyl isomerase [Actinomycetia bacterium]|nr:peptidylprolyl isomerase [Actinomycetes bacterium]
MKRILPTAVLKIIVIMALAVSIIFTAGCSKTVATVNDISIKQDEVEAYLNFILAQNLEASTNLTDEERKDLEISIVDSILVVKLLEQYAADNNIAASQEEIDMQMTLIIESYESESEFESELKSKDVDRKFLEDEIRNQILRNKIYFETIAGVMVTGEQLKEYYEENKETTFKVPAQVKASHILSMFPWIEDQKIEENDQDREKVRDKIEFVAEQLKNGAEFGDMAREYSDDTATSVDGGDLGFITRGQMVEEFETAVFSLDIEEVSGIVETKFGYHIIKVFDKQEEKIQEFEEVKENISTHLTETYKLEKWEGFLAKLIADADIQYLSENEGSLNDVNNEE